MNNVREVEKYLSVGYAAVVHADSDRNDRLRYATTIRGWQVGGYILLDTPCIDGQQVFLPKSKPCVVRFLSEGRACAFTSVVLSEGTAKNPYMKLSWPSRVKHVSIRKHERVDVDIACKVILEDGGQTEGQITDLSAGGCGLLLPVGADAESIITLSFSLPDATRLEYVRAVVCSVKETSTGFIIGCRFDESEQRARIACEFYVSTTLQRLHAHGKTLHRALVLEGKSEVAVEVRERLAGIGYDVLCVSCILDAFFSLRMAPPGSLWIGSPQKELSPLEICRIVKESAGFEELPVFVYGGDDPVLKENSADLGVTQYFPTLADLAKSAPVPVGFPGAGDATAEELTLAMREGAVGDEAEGEGIPRNTK